MLPEDVLALVLNLPDRKSVEAWRLTCRAWEAIFLRRYQFESNWFLLWLVRGCAPPRKPPSRRPLPLRKWCRTYDSATPAAQAHWAKAVTILRRKDFPFSFEKAPLSPLPDGGQVFSIAFRAGAVGILAAMVERRAIQPDVALFYFNRAVREWRPAATSLFPEAASALRSRGRGYASRHALKLAKRHARNVGWTEEAHENSSPRGSKGGRLSRDLSDIRAVSD